jgi:hypothetical protein
MASKASVDEIWAKLKSSTAVTRRESDKPTVNFENLWCGFSNDVATADDSGMTKQSLATRAAPPARAIAQQQQAINQVVDATDTDGRSSDLEAFGHLLQRSIALLKDSVPSVRRKALTDIKVH